MDKISTLRRYGLFDAKVPRYTSYPPANRFEQDVGARHQRNWLEQLPAHDPVSVYIHIPFCRRLCWFCACRTQGTKTLSPVEGYVGCCHAIAGADLSESTSALSLPVLAIAGREDGASPPALVQGTADMIAGSRFAVIEGAGHLPCVEDPAAYAALLNDFLKEHAHV